MANGVELATAYVSLVGDTRKLAKDINSAFDEAERGAARSGRKIGQNLNTSIGQGLGGSKGAAAKAGTDAAREYERALKSSIRGEKIGEAIGKPIGKGIGLAIKGGIGVAAIGATAVVGALATSLTKGFTRLKNIDNAKFKLEALGNSAGDVKSIMDAANKSVKGTAFGLDAAAGTAATAVAAGVNPGDDLASYLTNVADAAAIAQTSMEEMGSIFNKVQTNGKAMTDDLQMLADRGLPIFTWLQRQYGVTGEALQKMVEDGKVSSADFNRVISENIGGAAQKMGQSFEGAMQNLDAAMGRLGATILGVPFENASSGIGTITTALDKLNAWIAAHPDMMVDFWAGIGKAGIAAAQDVLRSVSSMLEAWAQLKNAVGDILGGFYRADAAVNRITGQTDLANERDRMADEFFAWGTKDMEAVNSIRDMIDTLEESRTGIDQWADRAKAAAAVTSTLGDSFIKVNDNGQIIVQSNAMEKLEEINKLGLVVKNLPDGSFEVVPGTPEAQRLIDAFVEKNGTLPPATVPVDVDISAAKAKLQGLYNEVFHAPAGFTPPTATPAMEQVFAPPPGGFSHGSNGAYVPYDPEAWKRPKFGGGRESGGPISGPGPKGKDSVLMFGAPGEHMWTDEEVDAVGGQAAMYRLRADALAGRIPGYENGGAIGAIDYAYNQAGKPYQYGTFDCSMLASQVYARMAGLPPGRYFATDSDFAALGFKKGYKPGALNIGTNGGTGTNGHMAVTLPNGVNAENSGSAGSMYGDGAKGANDFGQQWYYEPPNSGDMGAMQAQSMNAHGMGAGAPPGPVGPDGQPVTPGSGDTAASSGRTEGYIPAGAGNTSVSGTSFVSGLYNMGAEAINGLIDQAASAASTAATVGAMGTPGAGQGAALAIGMGANAAKRGVSYGAQMLGIGTDALIEQLTPFGAPRWLSTDPTAFMPQGLSPAATTTSEQLDPNQAPEPAAPPQANLQAPNPEDLQPAANAGITVGSINGIDPDQVGNELLKVQRYNALQYQGRP